ncbi:hypothetical protein evm_006200 [Chilo suppressalis]|nr:hypothetical protein evm_006200 [Chilo suppressalis]
MQRKPGFPVVNCAIKPPENGNLSTSDLHCDDDLEQQQRRQQLINFGHSQWGFNNWSWSVTKQELDFVDYANGKYCAGVVAYVSITVKNIDIHRENIGYATSLAANKGFAIYKSRKSAVTNALRETLLSFGGSVANELMESLETRAEVVPLATAVPDPVPEPVLPKPEKASPPARATRKEPEINVRAAHGTPLVANPPPVAKAHPMPAALPPPRAPLPRPPAPQLPPAAPQLPPAAPPPQIRPNPNEMLLPLPSDASEEARAERKRRQRQAQEEFRQRQMMKQKAGLG